jgi:hypothetical protein
MKLLHADASSVKVGVALTLLAFLGCKPNNGASADAGTTSTTASAIARPTLPPEPPPPVADKAVEVPGLEAALAKDAAYQAIWTGPRPDRNTFLSYVSELLATSSAPGPLSAAATAAKTHDAGVKLFLIFSRVGHFPDDFTKKLSAHLDATKSEPHLGTWAPMTAKTGPIHDYTALASWFRREDPAYLRERIAAKSDGGGPFHWAAWTGKEPAARPWLVDEVAAFDRLALLTKLTDAEETRRDAARTVAKSAAAAKAEMASAVQVAAGTLFADYQANEVSADDKYKGKTLLVSGAVADIRKGPLGGITVGLSTSNPILSVDASLADSEASKAGKLSKGDSVKLLCKGMGMVVGRPQLDDCTIR